MTRKRIAFFAPELIGPAIAASFTKLDPRLMIKNPVMFVVEVVSVLVTGLGVEALVGDGEAPAGFILAVAAWLWITVLFANFAEAMAEGRGKAQAEELRKMRRDTPAKRLTKPERSVASWIKAAQEKRRELASPFSPREQDDVPAENGYVIPAEGYDLVSSSVLGKGDRVLVEPGFVIPADGTVVEGIASVDESAVTGESAPVIREAGGDRSSVTGGTRVLSDWIIVEVMSNPGETFLDRIIALVEGARRQKSPNEIALQILLAGFSLVFLFVCATLLPFSIYSSTAANAGQPVTVTVLVALLVCLIPTTIGGLLSAIGIAG